MIILNLFSLLLDYPNDNSVKLIADIESHLIQSSLSEVNKLGVKQLLAHFTRHSLLGLQSDYDAMFERGRSLSLHLFEHIHGESRDRGQAMVNLQQQYRDAGLEISVKELPDYLPLYLEFLSTQGEENARIGLEEVAPILAVLACRLDQRQNPYAAIFHSLMQISGAEINLLDVKTQISDEKPDYTPDALDKVWEEEAVSFSANKNAEACTTSVNRPTQQQSRDHVEYLNIEDLLKLQPAASI
jgi:nitrate reductase delta subunit